MNKKDYLMMLLFASSIGSIIILLIIQLTNWFVGEVIVDEPIRLILGTEIILIVYAIIGLIYICFKYYIFHKKVI